MAGHHQPVNASFEHEGIALRIETGKLAHWNGQCQPPLPLGRERESLKGCQGAPWPLQQLTRRLQIHLHHFGCFHRAAVANAQGQLHRALCCHRVRLDSGCDLRQGEAAVGEPEPERIGRRLPSLS